MDSIGFRLVQSFPSVFLHFRGKTPLGDMFVEGNLCMDRCRLMIAFCGAPFSVRPILGEWVFVQPFVWIILLARATPWFHRVYMAILVAGYGQAAPGLSSAQIAMSSVTYVIDAFEPPKSGPSGQTVGSPWQAGAYPKWPAQAEASALISILADLLAAAQRILEMEGPL